MLEDDRKGHKQTIKFPLWLPQKDLDNLASKNFQLKSTQNNKNKRYEDIT